jgi:hypothetical protein
MPALDALLHGLIDYAGLFPPAQLAMADAVRNHAAYLAGPHRGKLGRFIVPVARLEEFEAALDPDNQHEWRLSVLAGADPKADLNAILSFNARQAEARIVSIETKAATPADIAKAAAFPPVFEVWVELPASKDLIANLAALKAIGRGAKLRTGGVTPAAFPAPADVAAFLAACRDSGIVAKATAGLHHPLRGEFALTYAAGAPRGVMFGFLNVFLAAALLHEGGSTADTTMLLSDGDPRHFACTTDALVWRDRKFTRPQLESTRRHLLRSFGSCSFTEPIEGLQELRWL